MRLLLDTNVYLWLRTNPRHIDKRAIRLVESSEDVYVSPVTMWEISRKQSKGLLRTPAIHDLRDVETAGFKTLVIDMNDAWEAGRLPDIHQDPFDRLLIAQAIARDLIIVTRDPIIEEYEVATISA